MLFPSIILCAQHLALLHKRRGEVRAKKVPLGVYMVGVGEVATCWGRLETGPLRHFGEGS